MDLQTSRGPAARRRPVLVAVAHGSRDPGALPAVTALVARMRALRPGLDILLGHVKLNEPLLGRTLARVRGEAVLVPLLFARGHHVTRDLPRALAGAPRVRGSVAAPLGPHPLLARALHARLTEAGWPEAPRPDDAVVLAAAGSRDPAGVADTERTAALLATRLGVPVLPGYAAGPGPRVPEAVATMVARGARRVAVASCFAAPGRFAAVCAAAGPWIVGAPLGSHEALGRLALHRYDAALALGL